MGRSRKTMHHLPERVYLQRRQYRYIPKPVIAPDGVVVRPKGIALGTTYAEAMRNWDKLQLAPELSFTTMGDLLDAYERTVVPTRHPTTASDDRASLKWLRAAFSEFRVGTVRPVHCYQYLANRAAKTRANRELACLSNVIKYGISLGLFDTNPTLKVTRNKERPRERNPETWELAAMALAGGPMLTAYILLKVLMGLRQGDMLSLRRDQIDKGKEGGIFHRISKGGKRRRIMEWSDELRAAVELAEAVPRTVGSMFLFSPVQGRRRGQQYTTDGFRSIWHRAMDRALNGPDAVLRERFHEHDIRAHTATEAARIDGIKRAQELMSHTNLKTTAIYVRDKEPERVRPLR